MNKKIILMAILVLALISCSDNTKKIEQTDKRAIETEDVINKNDIKPEKNEIAEQPVKQERNIRADRIQADKEIKTKRNPDYWEPLVINYYTVDYIATGKGAPKDVLDVGEWYKFEKDFSYEHGFFDKIYDKGKYSIDLDKKILMMLPEDKSKAPSEWRLLNSGDVIVMVGTTKFGNNPIQKHCQNIKDKPVLVKE